LYRNTRCKKKLIKKSKWCATAANAIALGVESIEKDTAILVERKSNAEMINLLTEEIEKVDERNVLGVIRMYRITIKEKNKSKSYGWHKHPLDAIKETLMELEKNKAINKIDYD